MTFSLLDRLKEDEVVESEVKLTKTQPLENFSKLELEYKTLKQCYESPNKTLRLFATLLNSILTQGRVVFIVTKKIMNQLVENDPNVDVTTTNTDSYKALIKLIVFKKNYLERTREPTNGKAGLYEVKDHDILYLLKRVIAENFIQAQKDSTYEWYDKTDIQEEADPEDEDPIIKEAKERVNARRQDL